MYPRIPSYKKSHTIIYKIIKYHTTIYHTIIHQITIPHGQLYITQQ
jgi:hypothetical protein